MKSVPFLDSDFKSPMDCGGPYLDKCVAVAIKDGSVGVRDTKDPSKATLQFTAAEWQAFTDAVKQGQFDV